MKVIRKSPEVIILAKVILAPKSDLRLNALNALQNNPNRHCKFNDSQFDSHFLKKNVLGICKDFYEGFF